MKKKLCPPLCIRCSRSVGETAFTQTKNDPPHTCPQCGREFRLMAPKNS
jgi:DNA-directed RNA polymerase subunit RPC12/RpoP